MRFSERISTFLRKNATTRETSSINYSDMQKRSEFLETAVGMAEWALEGVCFNDACNRAEILGSFLIHYTDHDEVKEAICHYLEDICQRESLPRWVRRDIIFCLSRHFIEPDINCVYDDMLNLYGYEESDCEAAERYYDATAEVRDVLQRDLDEGILKLLERYDQKKQYYLNNAQYISELYALVDSIECGKYGI